MKKHVDGIACYNTDSTGVTTPEKNCLAKVFLGSASGIHNIIYRVSKIASNKMFVEVKKTASLYSVSRSRKSTVLLHLPGSETG